MSVLTVGPGKYFSTLAAAVAASGSGDTILVDAGLYTDDFVTITHSLTIQGVGGLAHFRAVAPPPNGKAILTVQADLTLDHLELSGAAVYDANGAGIRYESGQLTITNSWLHDNENGLLAAPNATGRITIDRSEFSNNGNGSGLTHNIYVNLIDTLAITKSYFHDVDTGHEIKSRAPNTILSFNRIADGPNESASYSIDLPNGGNAFVTGNLIEKGLLAQNWTFISFGAESPVYPASSLVVSDNIFVNNMAAGDPTGLRNPTDAPALFTGNTFYGVAAGQLALGQVTSSGNAFLALPGPAIDTSHPFEVPEPGLSLLALAAMALGVVRRRAARRRMHAAVISR
jgi:hypothetical protein